ncbi:hypothetical protein [Streptomyces sp. NPDC017520]
MIRATLDQGDAQMSDFNMAALLEDVALSATLVDSRSEIIW